MSFALNNLKLICILHFGRITQLLWCILFRDIVSLERSIFGGIFANITPLNWLNILLLLSPFPLLHFFLVRSSISSSFTPSSLQFFNFFFSSSSPNTSSDSSTLPVPLLSPLPPFNSSSPSYPLPSPLLPFNSSISSSPLPRSTLPPTLQFLQFFHLLFIHPCSTLPSSLNISNSFFCASSFFSFFKILAIFPQGPPVRTEVMMKMIL